MTHALVFALTLAAALGSGLVGGIFFAFSSFVMTALGRLPPPQGIAAMQAINVAVLNPLFFAVFFGTGLVSVALAILALADWSRAGSGYLLVGSLLYPLGSILVTMLANVPLNRALAAVEPESAEGAQCWARYRTAWTAWNHLRTVASLAAAAALMLALA